MAAMASTMLALGTPAPDFRLDDTAGKAVSLGDFQDAPALLMAVICNHCPFVVHLRDGLAAFARDYQPKGLAVVAVSANDAASYPADGPAKMAEEADRAGYTFAYLHDEDQSLVKSLRAACTPEFYLFDQDRKLAYRGQFDDSRPSNGLPVTGRDLRAAADALLSGAAVAGEQKPSMGCSIKWKHGNAPSYA